MKFSLAALPRAGLLPALNRINAAETAITASKPDSKFAGVHVGLNVPYSSANSSMSGNDILPRRVGLISAAKTTTT